MQAGAVMTQDVSWVSSEMSLQTAHTLMQKLNVRHLPVVEQGRLRGILSDRDVLVRSQLRSDGTLQVPDVPIGEVMTPNPVTCRAEDSVATVAGLMLEHGIDSIPVTGLGEELKGLITTSDMVALLKLIDTLPER